jgi:flavin-binding protein dodecin
MNEDRHAQSVYKVIELIGPSLKPWEEAARAAVERAAKSLRDLRVAEVVEQDLIIRDWQGRGLRTKVRLSFKYEERH